MVCEHLSRHYTLGTGRIVAVDEVAASITRGMRVALTGPSGSGKSTLLHLWAGLDTPTSGRLEWPAWGSSPGEHAGAVGVVFQSPSLLPDLDVAENVALPLLFGDGRPTGAPPIEDAVGAGLVRLGISDLAGALPAELSGGQAQRVAVARVLVARPALILADEPTGRLDQEAGDTVITALLEVAAELDAALVVATHDPRVAVRLTDLWSVRDGVLRRTSGVEEASRP